LVVEQSLQEVDSICFYVDQEELGLELLVKVTLGLKGKDTSVYFLSKEVLRLLGSLISLEECKGLEYLFLFADELLQGQANIEGTGVEKGSAGTLVSVKVWGRQEFGVHI